MEGAYHIEQELFYSDDIRQDAGIGAAQDGWLRPTDSSLFTGKLLTDYSNHEFTKRNSGSVNIDRFLRFPDQANLFYFVPTEDKAIQ